MKTNIFLSLILSFAFNACVYDPPEKWITILNDTDSAIYVYGTYLDSISLKNKLSLFEEHYIEEAYWVNRNKTFKDTIIKTHPCYRINPYNGRELNLPGQESLLNDSPDKKIRIFYIKEETMRTKTWAEIVKCQLYEKKGLYDEEYLKKTDWTVTYP